MDNLQNSISRKCIQEILNQMNSYSKLIANENKFTICFFCYIKYNKINIPVMITNSNINKYLSNNKKIKVSINNVLSHVEFDNVKYADKNFGLTVIKIKENKIIKFLDLDEYFYKKDTEIYYNKKPIYTISSNNDDISITYGIIKNINESEIFYSKYKNIIPKYSPIFNLSNNKLIGLYLTSSKYYNKGISLRFIIKEFIREYKLSKIDDNKNNNEINILINISEKEINKRVYFLDNLNNENNFQ